MLKMGMMATKKRKTQAVEAQKVRIAQIDA